MDISILIPLMILFLLMEAFFSGAEIGVVSADRMKLRHDAANGSRGAALALNMLKKPEWLLSTTLVGTNIAIVTNTSLATLLAIQLFGKENGWMAIVMAAPLIWVFGEIVPKSIFQQKADVITPKVIFVLRAASILFYPLLLVFTAVTKLLTRLAGAVGDTPFTLRQEIDLMLRMPASQIEVQDEERQMIRRMFNFGETRVRDIVIPLIDVVAVDQKSDCGEVRRIADEASHLKLPVYRETLHRMIGVVDARELISQPREKPIASFVRPVRFIPASMSIEPLLEEFRVKGERLAVVVDEYGGVEGIVTIEDIMERIVGKLEDEYDQADASDDGLVQRIDDSHMIVNARADLITLKEEWGVALPDGPYETLGGFLMEIAGDIPREGETVRYRQFLFTVIKAEANRLLQVRIQTDRP